jgi:hypothetical protein
MNKKNKNFDSEPFSSTPSFGSTAMTTQSLPSFAQAFSAPTLNSISTASNALPPIHIRSTSLENSRHPKTHSRPPSIDANGSSLRKRSRSDLKATTRDDDHPEPE